MEMRIPAPRPRASTQDAVFMVFDSRQASTARLAQSMNNEVKEPTAEGM